MTNDDLLKSLDSPDAPVMVAYDERFSRTWQCSHVRMFRIEFDDNDYSRPAILSWILNRNRSEYIDDWKERINNVDFEHADIAALKGLIETCNQDILGSDCISSPGALSIADEKIDSMTDGVFLRHLKLYDYGPASACIWQSDNQFFYLELHCES